MTRPTFFLLPRLLVVLPVIALVCLSAIVQANERPNIVVIVADDLGFSDVGFNGCKEIPTPHLDELAADGIIFDAGYASHPYCSPSRAGLLAGRYQQRFGHECNPGADEDDVDSGLPLSETLLSNVMKQNGYRTGAIGKWHLGDDRKFWPTERGFDEWFGFSGGGMSYWGDTGAKSPQAGVLRNGAVVPKSELSYLTDDFSTEAIHFVDRNQATPFFLYLAYNAPHGPDQATREHLKKTEHIEYGGRAVYGAMVAAMDEGIGRVTEKLKALGIYENTLIFFYSDNGGRTEHAINYPYRGHKGMLFEGGIRVPFCVTWPKQLEGGMHYDKPITALDIFPTSLAAAGIDIPSELDLDGVNLLPYLQAENKSSPHDTLFWRYACGDDRYGYAVREGDHKLVYSVYKGKHLLFDLSKDPWERDDLAADNPALVKQLIAKYDRWQMGLMAPLWLDPHGLNIRKEEQKRQNIVDAAARGEK
ncbi:sulfatase-like hydrolase/transferase [Novipirellula sp. SH528]|uniref:sulfatase-like hydrolase/transferase n=1 Tax=Novipirellula sp. SH528 TaxID=3454466 RepID=UPI003FA1695D